ncbi:alpha/beta hydrolase [Chitinophaga silvatica]|uniref:Alpha/beta hydrolase n=1 Tax=Chitinophaga silvatica TaxID=2282649 RepID=A0A3E1Y5S5_9BACT|nr:alpha/beta hydrolase [Chitinophaga silvatica]RFS20093.1 alpha/beta hydrolase [Chitinophaga silvatica]
MNTTNQENATYEVEEKKVSFLSNGIKIDGILYLPKDVYSNVKRGPAIVVGHMGSAVKEQMPATYAGLLAKKGFIMLTFDAAFQGESEGIPRGLEDPAQRVEDLKAAISFLNTVAEVDSTQIGILGLCASGGYGITAASTDHRVKAIATVSGACMGRQFRNGADGTQSPSVIQGMLDLAAQARNAEANGAEPATFPLFPASEAEAKAGGQHIYEGWKYYCTKLGEHPRSAKSFVWKSVDRLAAFDAFNFIDLIAPRPLLMIYGSNAVTQWMTKEAISKAKEPKEAFVIQNATHVDLYWNMEYITPVIEKLKSFFVEKL